ncbi:MAG: MBL fold metallo-hydrolase [Myxococcaceae bacterium]
MSAPTSVHLFTYQVGFGDCFLLRFNYPDRARHVLIDFGSTAAAPKAAKNQMLAIAKDISGKCAGVLDAIVATHRHQDHVSGFAGKPWQVLAKLKPKLVVLPWTEHPRAVVAAKSAPNAREGALGLHSLCHLRSLDRMHELAAGALEELGRKGARGRVPGDGIPGGADEELELGAKPFGKQLSANLAFLGEDNLKNADAVKNLMSVKARDYLSFGDPTRLEDLLPGVKVHVLGPPTLEQSAEISAQRDIDRDEFWHLAARAVERSSRGTRLFPRVKPVAPARLPIETRWFLKRMDAVRGEQLLQLVRILDGAMNNTSLILLFEACGKKLLFPGDAQIENWSYALSRPEVKKLLKQVTVYKVGHHGSLNATPKSLWGLFARKGPAGRKNVLRTFLSTRLNKHGHASSGTEVPRKTLVDALTRESKLFSTLSLTRAADLVHEEQVAP